VLQLDAAARPCPRHRAHLLAGVAHFPGEHGRWSSGCSPEPLLCSQQFNKGLMPRTRQFSGRLRALSISG
jgi:hypothetical protein